MSKLRSLVPSPHSLFVFEAAARNLNFAMASRELNVTQPSVSHSIKALEKHCGTVLFTRENRGVQLTEAGRVLYDGVRASFSRMEESFKAISPEATQYLTLAASTSTAAHWLMPKLYELQHDHPNLKIKVVTTDRDVEPDSEIDMTIWIRDRGFQRPSMWFICDEVVFPVCSPSYLTNHPPVGDVSDLPAHHLLHSFDPHRKRISWDEWFDRVGAGAAQAPPNMVASDYQLVMQGALSGEGIALGWNFSAQLLLKNKLLVRPLDVSVKTGGAFFLVANERRVEQDKLGILVEWFLSQTADLR
ncbi:LysR substrate-binding domain-containing protein [Sinorhizobium americanum]|uniref:LysR substrate-binding domain-containing protein n=1 Tax=Sinorhizobium americanum TaxID=194963 RepID=UPI00055B2A18|nr:LysR substrate-binding domain-containing protein [Sinorhizobium americanum]